MKLEELKVGDFVRVKTFKYRPGYWNSDGKMNYLMGTCVEIIGFSKLTRGRDCILIKANESNYLPEWSIDIDDIDPISQDEPNLTLIL